MCEKGEPCSALEGDITDLQDKWERLSKLFSDLNEKLTAALVQVCGKNQLESAVVPSDKFVSIFEAAI